ncbi:MAG: DUF11 domain-containing protein [Candidatus Latescibacteria bacterium]|nr:DUF11 domain-containing protein [Candidatus Latescibacterota bacterium]NIM21961.1 DUF11 domain-containing protein [Candidatus Latescibacterota bacterium]NIM65979.1 DUF11 domain-containing protein [Candidatus Latescibacterota bacterium]NIO02387.1 DUF11 domain-containing protein [Candidatus Latescibacterota bacterium]NIO29297.1 DUF11 domain-containing protein [Candidatus Latescibacterota bacterium]
MYSKKIALLLIFPALTMLPLRAEGGIYTAYLDQDSWLKQAAPFENHGSDLELFNKSTPADSFRVVCRYDLSPIPAGETVTTAVAFFYVSAPDISGSPVSIYRVTDSWTESGVNWNNTANDYDNSTIYGTFVPNSPGIVAVDITPLVSEWVEGTYSNEGLMFISTSFDTESKYFSREWMLPSQRPSLVVVTAGSGMRMNTGSYTGTGIDNTPITGIGFKPDLVIIKGDNNESTITRSSSMMGDTSKALGAGTGLVGNRIQSLDPDGFTIGSDFQVNEPGIDFYWIAFKAAPNELAVGSYLGDGSDDRSIPTVGFQPDYVIVMSESPRQAIQRFPTQTGDRSIQFTPAAEEPDLIQAFEPSGFQVGSHPNVNQSSVAFHYAAWKVSPGKIAGNDYTGDGSDDRDITGVGFQPEYMLIKHDGSNYAAFHRPASLVGDFCFLIPGNSALSNSIQAFLPDGFQIGSDVAVNDNGEKFYWVAFRTAPALDLAVAKIVDNPVPSELDTVTYTVTLTNNGPGDATGVEVLDLLPAGVTYVSDTPSQGGYSSVTGRWIVGAISNGGSATLDIVATVNLGTLGTIIVNTATLIAVDQADTNSANNFDTANISVQYEDFQIVTGSYLGDGSNNHPITGLQFWPDLVIIKGDNDEPAVARTSTMVGDVSKELGTNSALLSNLITTFMPNGFRIGSGAQVNAPGVTYYWTAFLAAPGQMVVDSYVGNGTDNRSIGSVGFSPAYVIIMSEDGEDAMQRFASEPLDASLPFQSSDERTNRIQNFEPTGFQIGSHNTVNKTGIAHHCVAWNRIPGRIAENLYLGNGLDNRDITGVGLQPRYMILTRGPNGSPAVHRPSSLPGDNTLPMDPGAAFSDGIQTFLPDGFQIGALNDVNRNGDAYFYVAFRDAATLDLSIAKAVNDSIPNEGDTLAYTITVTNNGPDDATGVEVTDLLPAGVTYLADAPSQGTYASSTGLWTVGALVNSAIATLVINGTVDAGTAGSMITNVAGITASDQPDTNAINNIDTTVITVQGADLEISKIVDNPSPSVGDTLTYTIKLASLGPDTATGIEVSDLLPAGITYQSDTTSQGSYVSATGVWAVGTLASSDSATLLLTATVNPGTGASTITNIATILGADQADPDTTNNIASFDIVVQSSDLEIVKSADVTMPYEGDSLNYTVMLINNGPDTAAVIEVTDLLPQGVTYHSDTTSQGAYVSGTGIWTVGVLAGADTATLIITATVDSGTVDSMITNIASISNVDQEDPNTINNSDSVEVTVIERVILRDSPNSLYPSTANVEDPQLALRIGMDNSTNVGVMLDTASTISFTDGSKVYQARLGNPTYVPPSADDFTIAFLPSPVPTGIVAPATYDLTITFAGTDDYGKAYSDTISTAGRNSIDIDIPRIIIKAVPLSVEDVYPGTSNEAVLALEFHNQYSSSRYLDTLIVTNATIGPGGQFELDAEFDSLFLYHDVDSSRTLSAADTLVSTSFFVSGRTTFAINGGLAIPAGDTSYLFVAVTIDSFLARDGDKLDAILLSPFDVVFTDSTDVLEDFSPLYPVNSYGYLVIDGMVSHQISVTPSSLDTLSSGASDNLLLTAAFPQNGYEADTLTALSVMDVSGDFSPADFSALRLYLDDGDAVFDPGVDLPLGNMVFSGDRFEISGIKIPVGAARKFYVVADISTNANDGDHFRPAIPIEGVGVMSANDGPIDYLIAGDSTHTIKRIEQIEVANQPIPAGWPRPGAADVSILMASINNNTLQSLTLDSLSVSNMSSGAGAPAELDGEIARLKIYSDDGNGNVDAWDQLLADSLLFSGGSLVARNITKTLSAGETIHLLFACDIDSSCARDGDTLKIEIPSASSLHFDASKPIVGFFPLETPEPLVINGMLAHQIKVFPTADSLIVTEITDILVLDFSIPANGYELDTLKSIEIFNQGSANSEHFSRLALYADGGNGTFDTGSGDDSYLGDFVDMGSKTYLMPAMAVPLTMPCGQRTRFFAAADLHTTYSTSASIQFEILTSGIEVASGNDGPIDASVINPSIQLIPKPNELTVFPYSVGDKYVYPGAKNELNFGIGFYNGYSSSFNVETLKLFQTGTVVNSEIEVVHAFADIDSNGLFDPASDSLLAIGHHDNNYYTLDTLGLALSPKRITYLFVSYDAILAVRDSVSFNLQLNSSADITLSSSSIEIQGEFPINSPGVDFTDGMIAAQINTDPVPPYRAALGEDDVLALAFTIPSNGTLTDVLKSVAVQNNGTAVTGQDIIILKLWAEDGGNPLGFSSSDDRFLSILVWNGSAWQNPTGLSEAIPSSGLKCYVTFSVSNVATDESTFQARIPTNSIQVASGNDGPIDAAIVNPFEQTISTDPLLTSLHTDRSSYSMGQSIVLSMRVRNEGATPLSEISPSIISTTGSGVVNYQTGPSASSFDLPAGTDTTVIWTYVAASTGDISFCGNAFTGDSLEISEFSCSNDAQIQNRPHDIFIALNDLSPTSANRGQENVHLFELQCKHDVIDSLSATTLLDKLTLSFEDGAASPLPPNSILKSLSLINPNSGQHTFVLVDSSTNPVTLDVEPSISVLPWDDLVLDAFCQLSDSAAFTSFRIRIDQIDDIRVIDSNDSAAVTLSSQASFPWVTNDIDINAPAETLFVSAAAADTVFANVAQDNVAPLQLELLNGGDLTSASELLTRLTLSFYDTTGATIPPNAVIRKISLSTSGSVIYTTEDIPVTGNQLVCNLGSPLVLQPQSEKYIDILVDLKAFPLTDGFYLSVNDPLAIIARDFNSGQLIKVVPKSGSPGFPLLSSMMLFQTPASGVAVSHLSTLPPTLLPSMQSIPVMDIALTHSDTSSASSVELDSIAVIFSELGGTPLFPGGYFSNLRLLHNGDTLSTNSSLSSSFAIAELTLNPPLTVAPAASETLQIVLDTKSSYTPAVFEMRINKDQLVLFDSNDRSRIYEISGSFPLVTNPGALRLPSSLALCGLESKLPSNISTVQPGIPAFDLLIQNGNPEGSTDIEFRSLTVRIENIKGRILDPSQLLSGAYLSSKDSVIATGQITNSEISITIPAGLIVVTAGTTDTLFFDVDVSTQSAGENIRFVIEDSASVAVEDATTSGVMSVGTIGGTGYPLKSGTAHILGADNKEGFTNYPNPFAAGREETRITYYLDNQSYVTLELYTLWGAPVKTLLSNKLSNPGLHQDVVWDGRNDEGDVVNNGVYYLVLEIRAVGGQQSTLKRKVGVLR